MADDNDIVVPIKITAEGLDDLINKFKSGELSVEDFAKKLGTLESFDLGHIFDSLDTSKQEALLQKLGDTADEAKARIKAALEERGNQTPSDSNAQAPKEQEPKPLKPPRDHGVGQHYINVEREVFGETEQTASESTADVRLFREAIHALHPALTEAGIGMGELSSLVSAARGGFVALAVAIGTLVVTALQKAGDAANDAASRLGTFTGSLAEGQRNYEELKATSRETKTSASSLVAPYEQLQRVNQQQAPVDQSSNEQLLSALSNVVKGAESDRADPNKVLDEFTKLLSSIREKGFFGPDDLKALEAIAPKTAAAIEAQLPKGQSTYTGAQLTGAVRAAGPQIDANAIEAGVLSPSIVTAFGHLKASYERLAEVTTGGNLTGGTLDKLAEFFDALADKVREGNEKIEKARTEAKRSPADVDADRLKERERTPSVPQTFQLPEFRERPVREVPPPLGALDAENSSNKVIDEANKLGDAFAKTAEKLSPFQQELDRFHLDAKKAFEYQSSELALRQAEIEKKFAPQEAGSKLEKDRIAVQNADIHLEQARISGLEAQKGQDLSALAPESAQHAVTSARLALESARIATEKLGFVQGGDEKTAPHQYDQREEQLKRDQADEAERAAQTALKRAEIEKKYAYLEEPKANLAAEQAQTAIRSAELEKNDAGLRFSKDAALQPVSHDLQMLKYAEDQARFNEQANKYDQSKIDLLKQIVDKLDKGHEDKANKQPQSTNKTVEEPGSESVERPSSTNRNQIDLPGSPFGQSHNTQTNSHQTDLPGSPFASPQSPQPHSASQPLQPNAGITGISENTAALKENTSATVGNTSSAKESTAQKPTRELEDTGAKDALDRPTRLTAEKQFGTSARDTYELNKELPELEPYKKPPDEQGFSGDKRNISGAEQLFQTPTYEKQLREDAAPLPLPQPRPPEADTGPQSSETQQQFASLGTLLQSVAEKLSAAINSAKPQENLDQSGKPVSNIGIRGDANTNDDKAAEQADKLSTSLGSLDGAVDGAATKLADLPEPKTAAGGGHITGGSGSETVDSIPTLLAHNEFVHNAQSVRHYGLNFMRAVNNRTLNVPRLAGGGLVALPRLVTHMPSPGSSSSDPLGHYTFDMRTNAGSMTGRMGPDELVNNLQAASFGKQSVATAKSPGWRS